MSNINKKTDQIYRIKNISNIKKQNTEKQKNTTTTHGKHRTKTSNLIIRTTWEEPDTFSKETSDHRKRQNTSEIQKNEAIRTNGKHPKNRKSDKIRKNQTNQSKPEIQKNETIRTDRKQIRNK
jgi:hypothetical protein